MATGLTATATEQTRPLKKRPQSTPRPKKSLTLPCEDRMRFGKIQGKAVFSCLISHLCVSLHRLSPPRRRSKVACGNSSVGRARPCQGRGREFESRFPLTALEWWNGRHEGLKIPWPVMAVRVRVPLRAHRYARRTFGLPGFFFFLVSEGIIEQAHPRKL